MKTMHLNRWRWTESWLAFCQGVVPARFRQLSFILISLGFLLIAALLFHDFRRINLATNGVYADMATHAGASLSLAYDHDLVYAEADFARLTSTPPFSASGPEGIFLKRSANGTWYYSKPFLFPLLCSPWVWGFGLNGIIYFNALLFYIMILLAFFWLRKSLGDLWGFLLAAAFFGVSHFFPYVFVPHPDLLVAALLFIGFFLWRSAWEQTPKSGWRLILAGLLIGGAVYERNACLLFPGVLLTYMFWQRHWRVALLFLVAILASLAGFFTSQSLQDGHGSPYQGERYVFGSATTGFPYQAGFQLPPGPANASYYNQLKVSSITQQMLANTLSLPRHFVYFLLGRQTGLLLYTPLLLTVICLGIFIGFDTPGWLAVLFILLYWALNVVVNPTNPYGGATSLGNRYSMQVIALLLLCVRSIPRKLSIKLRLLILGLPLIFGLMILGGVLQHRREAVARHGFFLASLPFSYFSLEEDYTCTIFSDLTALNINPHPVFTLYRPDNMLSLARKFTAQTHEKLIIDSSVPLEQIQLYFCLPGKGQLSFRLQSAVDDQTFTSDTLAPDKPVLFRVSAHTATPPAPRNVSLYNNHYVYTLQLSSQVISGDPATHPGFLMALDPYVGLRCEYGEPQVFQMGGNGLSKMAAGWSSPESWGIWTTQGEALLLLALPKSPETDLRIQMQVRAFVPATWPKQKVRVKANGQPVADWVFQHGDTNLLREINLPRHLLDTSGMLWLEFETPDAMSPTALGFGIDVRILGMGLGQLWIDQVTTPPAPTPPDRLLTPVPMPLF